MDEVVMVGSAMVLWRVAEVGGTGRGGTLERGVR